MMSAILMLIIGAMAYYFDVPYANIILILSSVYFLYYVISRGMIGEFSFFIVSLGIYYFDLPYAEWLVLILGVLLFFSLLVADTKHNRHKKGNGQRYYYNMKRNVKRYSKGSGEVNCRCCYRCRDYPCTCD
ncbi:hypothetical protein COI93_10990 [Bacillus cereus]|uniref:Uncharacterized protein n=2 Tax=Bacillus cereus TaxID=1396 RepID=A0A2B0MP17_BACCE|nr:hypothetical protein COI93_10990 [Bacillus cereus]